MDGEEQKELEEQGQQAQEPEEKPAEQEADAKADDGAVVDKHGQPGINKERHEREMAAKDAEIAELKKKIEEASKAEQGRKDLEDKIKALEESQAEERVTHKLELEGCVDIKAARARLDDFEGDVKKLKSECPYLFAQEKQAGKTGLKPEGAAKGLDDKLDKAFGIK